jgi:membrane associated rhomboid family serine protease
MSYNDQYRPGGFGYLPKVTKNIIIINVVLFILSYALKLYGINLYDYLGLHHHLAPNFRPYQFVTYIFMHGNLPHIFFNMFAVYIFGQVLEQVWGPKRYLTFYILCGLGAAVVQYVIMHMSVAHDMNILNADIESTRDAAGQARAIERKYEYINVILDANVIVGASGSLFGLLGAFGMLFPNQYLYIYFLFPIKAKWFVIIYGAAELLMGFSNNPNDNVAHFAHIGGLFVGIILVLLWRRNRRHFY